MLVMSRKRQEKIIVGDNVVITVTRIHDNHVQLGIEAPRDIVVRRGELADERLAKEGEAA